MDDDDDDDDENPTGVLLDACVHATERDILINEPRRRLRPGARCGRRARFLRELKKLSSPGNARRPSTLSNTRWR